jgi:hypothetical protein
MALSFDLSGEQMPASFNAGAPPLAQLQPLQFQPINVAAPQFVPNTAGEKIAAGVLGAFGEIGKGITAAWKSKQDLEKEQREAAMKQADEDKKFEQQKLFKGMELQNRQILRSEALEDQKSLVDYRARLKSSTPEGAWSSDDGDTDAGGIATPAVPLKDQSEYYGIPKSDSNSAFPETNYLQNQQPLDLKQGSGGDLGQANTDFLHNLGNIFNPSEIKYVTASNAPAGAVSTDTGAQAGLPPQMPTPQGTFKLPTAEDIARSIISQPIDNPELTQKSGVKYPRTGFDSEDQMRQYIDSYMQKQGQEPEYEVEAAGFNPKLGKFIVKWKDIGQQIKERKQRAGMLSDLGKERLTLRQENTAINEFNQAADKLENNAQIKQARDKMKPTIEKFFSDFQEIQRLGGGYGANRAGLQQSLADQYVKFATGSIPTETQYRMLTSNRPLWDKARAVADKTLAGPAALFTPQEMKSMAQSMGQVLNMEHSSINTMIDSSRRRAEQVQKKAPSLEVSEDNMPHHFPILRFEDEVKTEKEKAFKDMHSAWGNGEGGRPNDPAAYKDARDRYNKYVQELEIAKTGMPANFEDLKAYGEKVGDTMYPAGWQGRLIYTPPPQITQPTYGGTEQP